MSIGSFEITAIEFAPALDDAPPLTTVSFKINVPSGLKKAYNTLQARICIEQDFKSSIAEVREVAYRRLPDLLRELADELSQRTCDQANSEFPDRPDMS